MSCIKTVKVSEEIERRRVTLVFEDCSMAEAVGFLDIDEPRLDVHVLLDTCAAAHEQSKRMMVVHTHPKGFARDVDAWNDNPQRQIDAWDEA